MLIHVVARALPGHRPFVAPATAWWLMGRLRLGFPKSLAACLMPDHIHLITVGKDPATVRVRMARLVGAATARAGVKHLFEPVPEPEVIANGKHLERLVRYVHLNPCRAKLAQDPMSWPWSTHRGLVGAEVDPWVGPDSLAEALGRPTRGFAHWLHAYTSSDPSVAVAGSEPPAPRAEAALPSVPLEHVRRAALGATPWSTPWVRRKAVVELAQHQGWRDTEVIARAAGLTPRSVRRVIASPRDSRAARASQLCLGDGRLLLPESLVRPLDPLPRAWIDSLPLAS